MKIILLFFIITFTTFSQSLTYTPKADSKGSYVEFQYQDTRIPLGEDLIIRFVDDEGRSFGGSKFGWINEPIDFSYSYIKNKNYTLYIYNSKKEIVFQKKLYLK